MEQICFALEATHSGPRSSEAEAFLLSAETECPGYYSLLQQIYIDPASRANEASRLLAAISFKNGIDKYWRKSAKHAISEEEKSHLRKNILAGSSSHVSSKVAAQNSVSVARIARYDYPNDWPHLFDELLNLISENQSNEREILRHLTTLSQVVKTLCSVRIARARQNFQEIAPKLLSFVQVVYKAFSERWIGVTGTNTTPENFEISILGVKIARKLICHGFETPYTDASCREFFELLSSHLLQVWAAFTTQTQEAGPHADLIAKHLRHIGKFFLELSSNAMENYALNYNYVLMPGSMEVAKQYWAIVILAAKSKDSNIRKVVVQGLILLKQCIKLVGLPETSLRLMKDKENLEVRESLRLLNSELFAPDSLVSILENLITLFFILRMEDIDEWQTSPEEWMLSQEETHWQFEIRPCAERVFLDLFAQFKSTLTTPLLSVLQATLNAKSGHDLLMKEAMYNALGIAAPHLFDQFDFDAFSPQLLAEVQDPTLASIFKRRILLLISQWVSVKCSEANRPMLYEIVGSLMRNEDEGSGLKLAAAYTVQQLVDEWDWQISGFEPYASHFIRSLVHCLDIAQETESKMKILTSLGLICERMGNKIQADVECMLQQIPIEWDCSEGEHLLKVALLGLLTRIVLSQKEHSQQCYPVVLPLIQYSTDVSNFESVYLLEEALELWHAVLQNATEPSIHLVQLFPILLQDQCLPTATENLGKILLIIESSIMLLPGELASQGLAAQLVYDMVALLSELKSDALSHFTRVLGLAVQIWGHDCLRQEYIWRLTQLMISPHDNALIQTCYICLLSQIILSDTQKTVAALSAFPGSDLTQPFINTLSDRFDNIGHAKHRKLCAMALTALLGTGHNAFKDANVLACLGNIWEDVLTEVQANGDDLVYWVDDSALIEDIEPESPETQRRKQVSDRDPVCTTRLKQYIGSHYSLVDPSLLGTDIAKLLA